MAAGQNSKSLVTRRRRARRSSDDEESVNMDGDSQSEGSVITGADEGDEADGSRASDAQDSPTATNKAVNGVSEVTETLSKAALAPQQKGEQDSTPATKTTFTTTADTRVMLNGMQPEEHSNQNQPEDYDKLRAEGQQEQVKAQNVIDRRRREQEEYQQKRNSDPAFIPNRGNFFMHDPRTSNQRGYAAAASRGRGRGRGFVGGPFGPAGMHQAPRVADAPWTHDLHESINEPDPRSSIPPAMLGRAPSYQYNSAAAARAAPQPEYRPYSFSKSKLLGNVQIRILLPNMKSPIPFSQVPVKQHTRLPDHRPPLRRDKPVRISLPDRPPRYIFPSQERSFIFIPRAMRPNQQGYGRSRGGFGPSSRRTSAYGGSIYTPSIAMSRRSSLARDIGREHIFSPAASLSARQMQPGRPIVRLPQGMSQPPSIASPAGSVIATPQHPFPLPQTPQIEHYRDSMTMHQPRPQKAISVSGIDSPAALSMHAPLQQDQQPFENQLPHHMTEGSFGSSTHGDRLPPYPPYHTQAGTPLSHIPERAIHAQPFQPPAQGYGPPVYGQYPPSGYYYPPVPVFVPQGTQQQAPAVDQDPNQLQQSMMAHESNGMIYYIDPSQMQNYPQQAAYSGQEGYLQPPSYAVPGMGGMMTPSPEASWYYPNTTGAVYYPQGQ